MIPSLRLVNRNACSDAHEMIQLCRKTHVQGMTRSTVFEAKSPRFVKKTRYSLTRWARNVTAQIAERRGAKNCWLLRWDQRLRGGEVETETYFETMNLPDGREIFRKIHHERPFRW